MKDLKYIRKRKRKYGYAFLIDIPYKDENGNQKHFTETIRIIDFPTEKAALAATRKIRNDALSDLESGKLRKTLPTIKNLYIQRWSILPLSVKSKQRYDNTYRHILLPYENLPLSEITIEMIQRTLNEHAEKYPPDAVRRVLTLWKSLYKTAAVLGYDIQDKTQGVIIPISKITSPPKNVMITEEDFRTVLDSILLYNADSDIKHNNLCIWYMLQIMYYTGCRPAEALALQRKDIHESFISINKSVGSTTTKKRQIIPTKNPASVRNVPIVPDLIPILESLLSFTASEQLLTDENGDLFEIDYISNLIRLATRKTGIHFNAYMLRHKMSSDLLHAGNAVVARDLLGHSSFGMTLDYARSTTEQLRSAIMQRNPAESQPKTKSHMEPNGAILRQYLILRVIACFRLICFIKAVYEPHRHE